MDAIGVGVVSSVEATEDILFTERAVRDRLLLLAIRIRRERSAREVDDDILILHGVLIVPETDKA